MALDGCRREVVVSLPSAPSRFVVFGAGVLGSLYAARLAAAGYDVTLVARGRRLADLHEHGLVVEDAASGERSVTRSVRFVEAIPPGETFAYCLVLVRKTQLADALEVLAKAEGVAAFVVMVNGAEGPDALVRERRRRARR
jgi:2-dehydropantoate 2-reductase